MLPAGRGAMQPTRADTAGCCDACVYAVVFDRQVTGTDGYIEVLMYHIDNREYVGRWSNPEDGVRDATALVPTPLARASGRQTYDRTDLGSRRRQCRPYAVFRHTQMVPGRRARRFFAPPSTAKHTTHFMTGSFLQTTQQVSDLIQRSGMCSGVVCMSSEWSSVVKHSSQRHAQSL